MALFQRATLLDSNHTYSRSISQMCVLQGTQTKLCTRHSHTKNTDNRLRPVPLVRKRQKTTYEWFKVLERNKDLNCRTTETEGGTCK